MPTHTYVKQPSQAVLFERCKYAEKYIYEKVMDKSLSHSLSTIVLPPNSKCSEDGTYMRLEGYSLSLFNEENSQQLITLFFNLEKETPTILDMHESKLNLLSIFGMAVKVFYNNANDFWRMFIDVDSLKENFSGSDEWIVNDEKDLHMRKRL